MLRETKAYDFDEDDVVSDLKVRSSSDGLFMQIAAGGKAYAFVMNKGRSDRE